MIAGDRVTGRLAGDRKVTGWLSWLEKDNTQSLDNKLSIQPK